MSREALAILPGEAEEIRESEGKLTAYLARAFGRVFHRAPAGFLVERFPGETGVTVWITGRPSPRFEAWEGRVNEALFDAGLSVNVSIRSVEEKTAV